MGIRPTGFTSCLHTTTPAHSNSSEISQTQMFQPPRGVTQNKCCLVLTLTRFESALGDESPEADLRAV